MIFKPIVYEGIDGKEENLSLKEYIKDSIPTARFWLMLKLRGGWNQKYKLYIAETSKFVTENLVGENDTAKKHSAKEIVAKIERGAWNTMPSVFLSSLNIPRVQRY